jgi:hypothetical protein
MTTATETRGVRHGAEADLRRRGLVRGSPLRSAERSADRLGEELEVLLADVLLNGEVGAAAPLEDVAELRRGVVGGAGALEQLPSDEDGLAGEEDVEVRARAEAVLDNGLVRLLELTHERLVRQVVDLHELQEAVDGLNRRRAHVAGVLETDELAGVVRDDVEAHRHDGTPLLTSRALTSRALTTTPRPRPDRVRRPPARHRDVAGCDRPPPSRPRASLPPSPSATARSRGAP